MMMMCKVEKLWLLKGCFSESKLFTVMDSSC